MSPKPSAHRSAVQPCDWPIEQLPGLSHHDQSQLIECGITTTLALIRKASNPTQKQALANQLQIHVQYVNKWVALADLARIKSVGCQYCGLLLHAGIGSASQLAHTPLHRLHQQILRLHVATMQRRDLCPSIEKVQEWIQQAQRFWRGSLKEKAYSYLAPLSNLVSSLYFLVPRFSLGTRYGNANGREL
jgi:hypothetical protein